MPDVPVRTPTGTLWTHAAGEGPAVFLCTGGFGCADYMGPVAEMLPGYRTIRADNRGCGRSDRAGPYTYAQLVLDLEAIREAHGLDQWLFVGHSAGARLGLLYALAHPDRVRALVCLACPGFQNDRDWHAAYDAAKGGEPLPPEDLPMNMDVNRESNRDFKALMKEPTLLRRLADLRVPTLFVQAGADVGPNWPARQLAALVTGARYVELPGLPHFMWLRDGEAVRRAVAPFLAEHAGV